MIDDEGRTTDDWSDFSLFLYTIFLVTDFLYKSIEPRNGMQITQIRWIFVVYYFEMR